MGLISWAFFTTGLKSLPSSHGPLLILADTTSCFLISAPMVSLRKRFVLVLMASSSPLLPLLLLDLLPHGRQHVPLDAEGIVAGGVVGREAGGVDGEDLAPDPREADEPS